MKLAPGTLVRHALVPVAGKVVDFIPGSRVTPGPTPDAYFVDYDFGTVVVDWFGGYGVTCEPVEKVIPLDARGAATHYV